MFYINYAWCHEEDYKYLYSSHFKISHKVELWIDGTQCAKSFTLEWIQFFFINEAMVIGWTVKTSGVRVNLGHKTAFKDTTKICFRWLNYLQAVRKRWQKDFFSKINVTSKPSVLELFCGIMCHFRETLANSNGIYLFSCLRQEFSISNICVLSLINYKFLLMVIVIINKNCFRSIYLYIRYVNIIRIHIIRIYSIYQNINCLWYINIHIYVHKHIYAH